MNFIKSDNFKLFLFLFVLLIVTCSPIWGVKYFVNQDGSAHLHGASLMLDLIRGNPEVSQYLTLNSFAIPNASGHWILTVLLLIFSPFIATKIIVTLTYILFVCAVGWLRFKTVGREGLYTSLLIGAVIGFNWLWFMGFYNFILGLTGFTFTIGLYYSWREKLNLLRVVLLALILVFVYLSHIISFGVLAGSIVWLSFFVEKDKIIKTVIYTIIALLPTIPLFLIYKSITAEGGFTPGWNITNFYSISSWITQIRTADAFIIISRKSFPFVNFDSSFFALFTPILWLFAAFFLLTLTTFFKHKITKPFLLTILPFVILFFGSMFLVVFAPDNFGTTNGWILRERILLCGLLFFIPIFRFNSLTKIKPLIKAMLIFVILFQTAAVWEFSLKSNKITEEFLNASRNIPENHSIASVTVVEDVLRFHSVPELNMNCLNGLNQKHFIWDNYELAYYVFPMVGKEKADIDFMRLLIESNSFAMNKPGEDIAGKLAKLESALSQNNGRIDTLALWGKDPKVEELISKYFDPIPYFQDQNTRLFKRK